MVAELSSALKELAEVCRLTESPKDEAAIRATVVKLTADVAREDTISALETVIEAFRAWDAYSKRVARVLLAFRKKSIELLSQTFISYESAYFDSLMNVTCEREKLAHTVKEYSTTFDRLERHSPRTETADPLRFRACMASIANVELGTKKRLNQATRRLTEAQKQRREWFRSVRTISSDNYKRLIQVHARYLLVARRVDEMRYEELCEK